MRVVDLSTPIVEGHVRWRVERRLAKSHDAPGSYVQATVMGWPIHGFTHMDTARHFDPNGPTTSETPLDASMGEAVVLDLSATGPDEAVSEDAVAAAGRTLRRGDIALLRTDWDLKASIDDETFWTTAPYMTSEASRWLHDAGVKAVGFDFPQDRCIRDLVTGAREPALEENVTHVELLLKGVTMFEYLCNLSAITAPRFTFMGLPLKIPDCDGSPVRAVALEP